MYLNQNCIILLNITNFVNLNCALINNLQVYMSTIYDLTIFFYVRKNIYFYYFLNVYKLIISYMAKILLWLQHYYNFKINISLDHFNNQLNFLNTSNY